MAKRGRVQLVHDTIHLIIIENTYKGTTHKLLKRSLIQHFSCVELIQNGLC